MQCWSSLYWPSTYKNTWKHLHRIKINKDSTLSTTGETIQTPTGETIQTPTQAQYPLAFLQRWSPLDLRVVQSTVGFKRICSDTVWKGQSMKSINQSETSWQLRSQACKVRKYSKVISVCFNQHIMSSFTLNQFTWNDNTSGIQEQTFLSNHTSWVVKSKP